MPEIRTETIEHFSASDEQTPQKIGETVSTVEVSDEELAEETERNVMEKAEDLIDGIGNLSQAKDFLKRLVRRLIKNGALP